MAEPNWNNTNNYVDPMQTNAYMYPSPHQNPHATYIVPQQRGYYPAAPGSYPIDTIPEGTPPDYETATNKAAEYPIPTYGQASNAPAPILSGKIHHVPPDDSDSNVGKWVSVALVVAVAIAAIVLGCVFNPLFFLGLLTVIALPIIDCCWPDSDNIPPETGDGYEAGYNYTQQPYNQNQGPVYMQTGSGKALDPLATINPVYTATYVQARD